MCLKCSRCRRLCSVCYSVCRRRWGVGSVCRVLEVPEVMRCMLLCVVFVLEVMRCVLFCMLEVPEVMRCVLPYMLEAVEGGRRLLEVLGMWLGLGVPKVGG